jgi:hypoxanthine-DNA glycosylase
MVSIQEEQLVSHGFGPVYDARSRILILGSFPSVKSREQQFYYGHPQNRFWKVLAALTGAKIEAGTDVERKERFLEDYGIALYDVIESCRITGSSDASIRDVTPADLGPILAAGNIEERIYANGTKAYDLYMKHIYPVNGIAAVKLPSTSPANAAWSLARLTEKWQRLIGPLECIR